MALDFGETEAGRNFRLAVHQVLGTSELSGLNPQASSLHDVVEVRCPGFLNQVSNLAVENFQMSPSVAATTIIDYLVGKRLDHTQMEFIEAVLQRGNQLKLFENLIAQHLARLISA